MSLTVAPEIESPLLHPVHALYATLGEVSLADVQQRAGLQNRVDTKFIATPERMIEFIESIRDHVDVLTINNQRTFAYDSIYFDSPNYLTYREHLQGRRRRFKVRTRTYVDTDYRVLEVKTKGLRGRTEKVRIDHRGPADVLDETALAFVTETLTNYGIGDAASLAESLRPALRTSYRRTTIVGRYRPFRMTVDEELGCADEVDSVTTLHDRVLIETKTEGARDPLISQLYRFNIRPVRMSKYCAGIGMLTDLPSPKWNPTIHQHLRPFSLAS